MNKILLKKQIYKFIFSGICAVLTDMLFYYILSNYVDIATAKGVSFLVGTITAYLMNKYYTFEQKEKNFVEILKFVFLYMFSLSANVFVNSLSFKFLPILFKYLQILDMNQTIKFFSFLFATGTSTIINFVGQKFFVFKK